MIPSLSFGFVYEISHPMKMHVRTADMIFFYENSRMAPLFALETIFA